MKKINAFLFILLFSYSQNAFPAERLEVLCTTTHLGSIVKAIGNEYVKVTIIIPFGMCPGHFDISPAEIKELQNTDIVLYHGFERFIENLISNDNQKQFVKMDGTKNLMIPEHHIKASKEIEAIVSLKKPDLKAVFSRNLKEYIEKILQTEKQIKEETSSLINTIVICSEMNREILTWLGSDIIATFPRDEDISLKTMHNIVTKGKNSELEIVIDNLQSSGKVGKSLAEDLGVPLVMLSNFPEKYNYIATLKNNCNLIMRALTENKKRE